VICLRPEPDGDIDNEVLIGEWDATSDDLVRPLRMPRNDFQRLFSLKGGVNADMLASRKASVRDMSTASANTPPAKPSPSAPTAARSTRRTCWGMWWRRCRVSGNDVDANLADTPPTITAASLGPNRLCW
jgi:hypothetical protein